MQKDVTTIINNNIVYVGIDVHKDSFTLCSFEINMKKLSYVVKVPAEQITNML